jgi:hypothetical protein
MIRRVAVFDSWPDENLMECRESDVMNHTPSIFRILLLDH